MSIIQLPSGKWRVQIRRRGFPRYDRVFPDRKAAQAAHDALLSRLDTSLLSASLSLKEAWEKYSDSLEFEEKAEETKKTERTRIKPVLRELGDYSLAILEQSPLLIHEYKDTRSRVISSRTNKRISPTSVRLELAALSAVVHWAKERRIVRENFVRFISRPRQTKRKRRVPPVEQANLKTAAASVYNPELAQAARFLLIQRATGCRPGELSRVLRKDIAFRNKTMIFRKTKFKREDRAVHLTKQAIDMLDKQYAYALECAPDSPYLFSSRARKRDENDKVIWQPWYYRNGVLALKQAGVLPDDFHAHALRREFISRAIEDDMSYAMIRKQTGHHSNSAIELYDEGLATSEKFRGRWDQHEKSLLKENFIGVLESFGISKQDAHGLLDATLIQKKSRNVKTRSNGEITED